MSSDSRSLLFDDNDAGSLARSLVMSEMTTVVIPTLDEEAHIENCIRSLVHDRKTEILVVDGGSNDTTVEICRRLQTDYPSLRIMDNSQRRTAAAAMNLGVAVATRDVIVRVDAHSVYSRDYLQLLVSTLLTSDAWATGGYIISAPRRATIFGRAVAASLNSRFVMGGAKFRGSVSSPTESDSVPFGCFRRSVFDEVGLFNESLARSQDYDFFHRIRAAGGKILLVPGAEIVYQARSGFNENIRYNFWNGYWVTYPRLVFGVRFSLRHYAPLVAATLAGAVFAFSAYTLSAWPVAVLLGAYVVVLAGAVIEARSNGVGVALTTGLVALLTHACYAAGCLCGSVVGVARRWTQRTRS